MSYRFIIPVRGLIDFARGEGFDPDWAFTVLREADMLEPSYPNQYYVALKAPKAEIVELWRATDAAQRLDRK